MKSSTKAIIGLSTLYGLCALVGLMCFYTSSVYILVLLGCIFAYAFVGLNALVYLILEEYFSEVKR